MSAIIRMNEARLNKYVRLSSENLTIKYGVNHLQIHGDCEKIGALQGDTKVKNRKGGAYKSGDYVVLSLGTVQPQRFELLVQVHPDIHAKALVCSPIILPANVESTLTIALQFREDMNLHDLPYLFAAYLVD